MKWFLWGYRQEPPGIFCKAQDEHFGRCVKVAGHITKHDFGGRGLLAYSEGENSPRVVPAQALVDALKGEA